MKTIIDIGNAHAGIIVTYKPYKFVVKSHGPGSDERVIETDEFLGVVEETAKQAMTLGLMDEYTESRLIEKLLEIGNDR